MRSTLLIQINNYRLFTSWEVHIGKKLCPRSCSLGRYSRQRAQFFSNTDRPRLLNSIFIFFYNTTKRLKHFRAVIRVQFATKISSEQILMKTEVIQVKERGFT